MRSAGGRRVALTVAAGLVLSQLSVGAASAGPAAGASPAPSAAAGREPKAWARPPGHPGAAAKKTLLSSGSRSPSQSYQGTNPPSPCYYSLWSDPKDVPELDGASYGALYDCPTGTWTFPVSTYDSWPSSELDFYAVVLETDGNFTNGCNGADYALEGIYNAGTLQAALFHIPDCTVADWTFVATAGITRSSSSQVSLSIPSSAMGSPPNLRWYAELKGLGETVVDDMPDTNAVPNAHQEDGYLGNGCTVLLQGAPPSSYAMVDDAPAAAAALNAGRQPDVRTTPAGVVRFSGDPVQGAASLARAGIQATVSADHLRSYTVVPNDTSYPQQWSLPAVKAPAAWDVTTGSASVVVADLDSGVDPTHPDLAGKLVAGYDAITGLPLSTTTNSDPNGHGTATAGVLGAATNNGAQLASLGWATSVMPVKVGDAQGAFASDAAKGIQWATDHGAKVINMSIGGCGDTNEASAVNYALSHGVLVVASAGNEATVGDRPDYPAAYPGVLAVGATDFTGAAAYYSNFGSYIDMVAPGGSNDGNLAHDILVLAPGGGTTSLAGTSFSSPLVAAAGALVLAANPALTAASARSLLIDTATDIGVPGRDGKSGSGILNAALAVQTAALRAKYNPLAPSRILDTRDGTGGPAAPVGAGQTRLVKVTGAGGVPPTGATAVVLNVTAVSPSAASFLTLFPSDVTRPLASNLNFPPGVNIPNLVVVRIGGDGNVAVYNDQGNVHVIFDVVGWYGQTGDSYNALAPARVLDTRNGTGGPTAPVGPGQTRAVKVTGVGNVPASGATAVILNVTAVGPSAASYLTVFPSDVSKPLASNLNFGPGVNIPNLVVVKVGPDGNVSLYNDQGNVDVVFDVVGWFGQGGAAYGPLPPHRILDTRDGTGGPIAPLGPGESRLVKVSGVGGVPGSLVSAVVLNVTAVAPSAGSFLTLYPSDVSKPLASNLNFGPGVNIPNLVVVKIGVDGNVRVYNDQGSVHVIFDVVGWYTS